MRIRMMVLYAGAWLGISVGVSAAEKSMLREYRLQHLSADHAEEIARKVLTAPGGDARVYVDRTENRLMVDAPERVQRLAAQLLVEIDRPTADATPPIVKSYDVPPAQLDELQQRIERQFPVASGVRLAPDRQVGKIVVLASPDQQDHIAKLVDNAGSAREQKSGETQRTPTPDETSVNPGSQDSRSQQVRLHRAPAQLVQSQLIRSGFKAIANTGKALHTYARQGTRDQTIHIQVDPAVQLVSLQGSEAAVRQWTRVIHALDAIDSPTDEAALVHIEKSEPARVQRVMAAIESGSIARPRDRAEVRRPPTDNRLALQAPGEAPADSGEPPAAAPQPPAPGEAQEAAPGEEARDGGLIGDVQVEYVEGLDQMIIRGNRRDVARVLALIEEMERLSAETAPDIQVLPLQHADSAAVGELVSNLYQEMLASRQGSISILPLVKPNALLLVGRAENVKSAVELIRQLDQPVPPDTQFQVFRLKHTPSLSARQTIVEFYQERGGLGARIRVVADYRTNSLIVQAGPRDLNELSALIDKIDVPDGAAVNEVRVVQLKNAIAEDVVPLLEEAFRTDDETIQGGGLGTGGAGGAGGFGAPAGAGTGLGGTTGRLIQPRSAMLTITTPAKDGKQQLKSGILTDARVTADSRTNSLVVTAPSESMPLILELIEQIDQLPAAEAQIKVFTVSNGDATRLAEMLQELFGRQQQQGQQDGLAVQTAGGSEEGTLVPLRFSVDQRTNSIIASGSNADLDVVHAILLRLDDADVRERRTTVFRVRNADAAFVADSLNQFLESRRQVQLDVAPETLSPFEQIEREVVIVPEIVSNSLIISATPRYFDEVMRIVEELDRRPPMVMIQVLIAEVTLNSARELGFEWGLQESLLFDRSVVTNNVLDPGFNFNNRPLGTSSSAQSQATRNTVASQGLTNFALGRTNPELGYGGLVISASSDAVSVLIRALQEDRRVNILSRPQIQTLDNQQALVQVGQQVPRIAASNIAQNGAIINSTVLENTGIVLAVRPRVSPDGLVVMEIDATKSELGPIDQGIPIAINDNGDVIRSPVFDTTRASTVISARNGQTVVLGGLITTTRSVVNRGIPGLSDLPLLGRFFRFDGADEERRELLFIMTPYIVRGDEDIQWLKAIETERMSWCLSDVYAVHGDLGLDNGLGEFIDGPTVIYPDQDPHMDELLPAPAQPENQPLPNSAPAPPNDRSPPVLDPATGITPPLPQVNWKSSDGVTPKVEQVSALDALNSSPREVVPLAPRSGQPGRAVRLTAPRQGRKETKSPVQPVTGWSDEPSVTPHGGPIFREAHTATKTKQAAVAEAVEVTRLPDTRGKQ